jgi:hypothetical protein
VTVETRSPWCSEWGCYAERLPHSNFCQKHDILHPRPKPAKKRDEFRKYKNPFPKPTEGDLEE